MTYDNTAEIQMKTTHYLEKMELIISDNFSWWK